LIAFLDASDPYVMTELEDDISADLEDGGDTEPSLGTLDRATNQTRDHGGVGFGDLELDPSDDEPSLGSLDHNHSQERWAVGGLRDLERDCAESGIGDQDGLLEQIGTQDWQQGAMA
jgi:hypothetical protein